MNNRYSKFYFYISLVPLIVLLALHTQPAEAYINPGSGSDLFQIIYSGILSVLMFFKTIFLKIKGIFIKTENKEDKYE